MLQTIKNKFQGRYQRWIDRRIPAARTITLDQRRIFIVPSRQGFWFLLMLLLMLLAAINYENNMVYSLVFLLVSVFIVTILHTVANLSGLSITAVRASAAFAASPAEFELSLSRQGDKDYYDISLCWPASEVVSVSLLKSSQQTINLHLPTVQRGLFRPGRLRVETYYPLGLLRAWTWIAMDMEAIVYPMPVKSKRSPTESSDDGDGELVPMIGSDDFYQFKEYQKGDSLKHVFWKSYAKGQRLQTKHYASYREQRRWLSWDSFEGNTEQRLSNICYWVLKLENSDEDYGVRLPGVEIHPGHGAAHQKQILTALALFDHASTEVLS